jgi:hypothetical protein
MYLRKSMYYKTRVSMKLIFCLFRFFHFFGSLTDTADLNTNFHHEFTSVTGFRQTYYWVAV